MVRYLKTLALSIVLAAPAIVPFAQDVSSMTPEERAAFGAEVRAYLLENPEVIYEAIQVLEERRDQEQALADRSLVADNAQALFNDGFSFVAGNPNGDVTIVEFLDYQCGFCKRAHPVIEELLDRDPNLRLVVKDFPILGPESVTVGRMALAAVDVDPSKFQDLNDGLMTYQGQLSEAVAYRIAGSLGYDIATLKALAESDDIEERIQQNYQLAQALRLEGTPAFVIGEEIIRGFLPVEDMQRVVAGVRNASN